MDLDVMHRQMRDLVAFKQMAEPIIAKMKEFLSLSESEPETPAEPVTESKADDTTDISTDNADDPKENTGEALKTADTTTDATLEQRSTDPASSGQPAEEMPHTEADHAAD